MRATYRQLRKDARNTVADLGGLESAKLLCAKMAEANQLLEKVEKPREQAVDSELFLEFTEIGQQVASKLMASAVSAVTPMEYIKCLRSKFVRPGFPADGVEDDPELFRWQSLGSQVCQYFSCVPGAATMNGPLDTQPKQRKASPSLPLLPSPDLPHCPAEDLPSPKHRPCRRSPSRLIPLPSAPKGPPPDGPPPSAPAQVAQRAKKRPLGEVVRPGELSPEEMEALEKQETDRNMEEMWQILHKERPTLVLPLIMNHESFAQTVENLFSLSFLVKDERVALKKTPKGLAAFKKKRAEHADFESGRAENMQFVIQMDMNLWRDLKDHVRPSECLVKNRPKRDDAGAVVGAARKAIRSR